MKRVGYERGMIERFKESRER